MKKCIPIIVAAVVVAAGAGFYCGMKYSPSRSVDTFGRGTFQNLSPEERAQRFQQMGGQNGGQRRTNGGQFGGGMVSGEIISKDDKSITVKLRDGGSKIVFYSDATEIAKSVLGTVGDLEVGKTVSVNGSANSDGSVSAQMIQLRSPIPTPSASPTAQ